MYVCVGPWQNLKVSVYLCGSVAKVNILSFEFTGLGKRFPIWCEKSFIISPFFGLCALINFDRFKQNINRIAIYFFDILFGTFLVGLIRDG